MQKKNGLDSENQKMLIQRKEMHISNLNQNIELLLQSFNDLNKKIQILLDKSKRLKINIPDGLKVIGNNVLENCMQLDCILTNDQIENLDNIGRDALNRKKKLDDIVKMQKDKIKALKKILVPYLIEQIKTEFEKNDADNELKSTEFVLKEVEKQIEVKSKEKDEMLKNYLDNVKQKLKDIKSQITDADKNKIKKATANLNGNRKTFYEQKLERVVSFNKKNLIEDYAQKLIMVLLQSSDNLDKISYEDVANKLAGNRQDLKNIMNKTVKSKFANLLKDSENVIFKTDLYNKNDLEEKKDKIKNICNQGKAKKDQLSEKIAQLNKISNEVNDALSLKLVSDQKMCQREITGEDEEIIFDDIMRNIKNENVKEQYFGKTYSYAERVNQYKKNVNDYKILINELIKKFPVQNQNQNHGIFNMIDNAQNQNNNNIPQMEDNNNINRINIINEEH